MALLLPVESSFGFQTEDAYCRIESLSWSKRGNLTFSVATYFNQKVSASATALLTQTFSCDYSLEGDNPIKQAYLYLKSLPEFANAVDC